KVLPGSEKCQLFFQWSCVCPWPLRDVTQRAAPYSGGTQRGDTRRQVSDSFTPDRGRCRQRAPSGGVPRTSGLRRLDGASGRDKDQKDIDGIGIAVLLWV